MSDVPHGTVLGPLLFALYINGISTDIDSEIKFLADDCVCYIGHIETSERYRSIRMLGKEMGYEMSTCQMQYDANNKETDKKDPSFIYTGWNCSRKCRMHQVYWGTITNDLRWNTHVSNVKANRTLGLLIRNLYTCPQAVKEAAYKELARPVLEYSGSVWDPSGVGVQNELEKVQNRAARFVTGNYIFETGGMTGILEHLKWASLKKRKRDSRLILLYKGLKSKDSIPTDDLIPLVRRCRNNHSMAYQVPTANTDAFSPIPLGIGMHFQTLISSAEGAEDGVAKFTSLVRARD